MDLEDQDVRSDPVKPLATTRSRRANAGNLMGLMIDDEEDEFYTSMYGGFQEEEDDADFDDGGQANKDADTNSNSGSSGSSCSSSSSSSSSSTGDGSNESSSSSGETADNEPQLRLVKKEPKLKSRGQRNSKSKSKITTASDTPEPLKPSTAILPEQHLPLIRTCSVCLGNQKSEEYVIECDSCGVQVHESCYGVTGDDDEDDQEDDHKSDHSHNSSKSTEPWFCEPCVRSVRDPYCELCPNRGGIFKETDTGRWVHMVCALYTRGVTFENTDTLTGVSLFELNYSLYGSKACTICEDRRLARSGICIGCDAGLCKTFFHATCAQKEGLLFESHSDEVDPYFAQCILHADKTIVRKKKRTFTALQARLKNWTPTLSPNSEQYKSTLGKLKNESSPNLSRWSTKNMPPIPPKASRMLMTSPALIMKLTRKSELLGLDPKSASYTIQDEVEMARQKWHIPPSFDLEFVAYCKDRVVRMTGMRRRNLELEDQNSTLKREESSLRDKFNRTKEVADEVRSENEKMIQEARALQKLVTAATGKQFNLPVKLEQLIARSRNSGGNKLIKISKTNDETSSTYCCGKCGTVKDQHLLALCDTCHSYLHIYCLDPPLTRRPKKTKFGGWQCSDCAERDEEEQGEALEQNSLASQDTEGPRRLRERIKYPDKYSEESMLIADFWSTQRKRPKKSSKNRKGKKIKVEAKQEAH